MEKGSERNEEEGRTKKQNLIVDVRVLTKWNEKASCRSDK